MQVCALAKLHKSNEQQFPCKTAQQEWKTNLAYTKFAAKHLQTKSTEIHIWVEEAEGERQHFFFEVYSEYTYRWGKYSVSNINLFSSIISEMLDGPLYPFAKPTSISEIWI